MVISTETFCAPEQGYMIVFILEVYNSVFSKFSLSELALLKAQICTICFHTCTQIFGIHKALMHVLRYKLSRHIMCKIQYMLIVTVHYAK